jgi:hypothetical protein
VFPSSRGDRLSHDAMQDIVTKHVSRGTVAVFVTNRA